MHQYPNPFWTGLLLICLSLFGDDNLGKELLWLWLQGCGVTRTKQHKLLGRLGDIESIYKANLSDLNTLEFLTAEDLNSLSKKDLSDAEDMQRELNKLSARVISIDSPLYPEMLRKIHQCPSVLYARGSYMDFNSSLCVAMVGTRKATNYGRSTAYNIARQLSENGITVVSGLAMGIDAKCHEGALSGGHPTVAVIGSGLDNIYPRINTALADKILRNGAILSEYPLGAKAEKYHFPERNRIIAGMCKATAVIEADLKSGSLITAKYAAEENRDVFAVPGNINTLSSKGTNYLLKDGAQMLTSAGDIMDFYSIAYKIESLPSSANCSAPLTPEEKILAAISGEAVHKDMICERTCLDAGTVSAHLLMLEIKGKIIKLAGGYYSQSKNI